MKKSSRVFALILAVLLLGQVVGLVACNPKTPDNPNKPDETKKYDQETRPFTMSISTPDGVFNPYFSSSAYDSQIAGITQIGMLSTDKNGKIVCGEDEPTVAKDYDINEVEENGKTYTDYEFLIKNGIKFSDGVDLTINDVLFNLYVYLDPAYTGSSTIYSTDIVGLKAYRQQNEAAGDEDSFEQGFIDQANVRIERLKNYVKYFSEISSPDDPGTKPADDDIPQLQKDFLTVAAEFKKELNSDWNAIDINSYKDNNKFTDKWQVFLLNDGGITEYLQKTADEKIYKDKNGNYLLDKDAADKFYSEQIETELNALVSGGMSESDALQQVCVGIVLESYFPTDENGDISLTGVSPDQFSSVVSSWGTAATISELFAAEAKSEYFSDPDLQRVDHIKGITTKKVTDFKGKSLDGTYDVLCIRINDIDPKAIYNFSFTVSPMHYYSTHNWNGKDYIKDFNKGDNDKKPMEFGLEFGNITFMNEVINAPEKVGLPVGAGAYMASNAQGDQTKVSASTFFSNNMVYYERNPYFHTVGKELSNAKIKYIQYKVVETDQIIGALINRDIDFGEPNAVQENIDALIEKDYLDYARTMTNGYGYVGINPRFVPNINVRRAIMKAFNTSTIVNDYYKGGLAEIIYRPISKASWAYPDEVKSAYVDPVKGLDYRYDHTGGEIERMVYDAGYRLVNGVYQKEITGWGTDKLNYKFTIAGGSTDHPAYKMFLDAMQLLNEHGFDVQVVTSQTALSDLSTGKLAVWAAAWSSTVDPDMYQIYHKDSKASSTSNWGYSYIKGTLKDKVYSTEWQIVQDLSDLIDEGRKTNVQEDREDIYAQALDKIMELAVEFPTYQRNDISAFNKTILKRSSMTSAADLTPYNGLLSRIWEVEYN